MHLVLHCWHRMHPAIVHALGFVSTARFTNSLSLLSNSFIGRCFRAPISSLLKCKQAVMGTIWQTRQQQVLSSLCNSHCCVFGSVNFAVEQFISNTRRMYQAKLRDFLSQAEKREVDHFTLASLLRWGWQSSRGSLSIRGVFFSDI